MPWHLQAYPAAFARPWMTPFLRRLGKLAMIPLLASLASSCTTAPGAPLVGYDPSNPQARTPSIRYHSTVAPYASRRPVEPAPWQGQNERATPAPKSGQ
jgi:hypothetical protein